MSYTFKKIAQVNVFHNYYKSVDTIALSFEPNQETQALLKRYGILFKTIQNGFQLYTNTAQKLSAYLNYISNNSGVSQFGVRMTSSNPDLYIFTNLPLDWDGIIQYNTSNTNDSGNVLKPNYSNTKQNADFGIVNLDFNDLISSDSVTYSIQFDTRKTQWNYYIINNSKISLSAPFIQTKSDIEFGNSNEVALPNGQTAIHFSSGNDLIALHNYPSQKFSLADKLVKGNSEKTKVIFTGLPNPIPGRIEQTTVSGQKELASPMYVYI